MFLLPPASLRIAKTNHKGRACIAKAEIAPGLVVGDYLGKILSERMLNNVSGLYAIWRTEKESIWPDPASVGIHLINHSCTPNLFIFPYQGHVLYVTLRRIFPGEEFTVNYLLRVPDAGEDEDFQECACGSNQCKATMYSHNDTLAAFEQTFYPSARARRERDKPIVRFGQELPPLASYPKNVPDYPLFDLFGTTVKPPLRCSESSLPTIKKIRGLIRSTGRQLAFPAMKLAVQGVVGDRVVAGRW